VRQLASFGVIGIASTLGYLLLYAVLHTALGAQGANLLALLLTAIANTAANRRFTFHMRGRTGAARHQMEGLAVFAASVVLTSGALAVLHALDPAPSVLVEGGVLVAANLGATLLRFVLFRAWVFNPSRSITLTRSEDR
jgi:putative flippase GtrA